MLRVNCHELTFDEQLALAGLLSDRLDGRAVALIQDQSIVFDPIKKPDPTVPEVEGIVREFLSRRKDADYYSAEVQQGSILIHSADPLSRTRGRKDSGQGLPPNLLKCPFHGCGFITPYPELLRVHVMSH